VPDLCPSGFFCPDDASSCLPLVSAGGRCQLNRDGELASSLFSARGVNTARRVNTPVNSIRAGYDDDHYGSTLRTDECAPPPGHPLPDLSDPWGSRSTGSVCLLGVCMWADVAVGATCTVESTVSSSVPTFYRGDEVVHSCGRPRDSVGFELNTGICRVRYRWIGLLQRCDKGQLPRKRRLLRTSPRPQLANTPDSRTRQVSVDLLSS